MFGGLFSGFSLQGQFTASIAGPFSGGMRQKLQFPSNEMIWLQGYKGMHIDMIDSTHVQKQDKGSDALGI